MRAAVLRKVYEPQTIEKVEIDEPHEDEVLVRTVASGVCHSDLNYSDGIKAIGLPAILGHESAGIVESVGRRVTSVKPGDHVVACGSAFCGRCEQCLTGHPNLCTSKPFRAAEDMPRLTLDGERLHSSVSQISGFAEYLLLTENGLVKIDSEMPLDLAALLGCALTTGIGAVFNTAKVLPGSSVVVFGAGGVGLSIVQGARLAGAREIIAVDIRENKLQLARELGATRVVNSAQDDAVARIKEITEGGAHYSFDAIGLSSVTIQALGCLAHGGTATIVGVLREDDHIELSLSMLQNEKKLQHCTMGSNRFKIDLPRMVDFYLQGRLKLEEMISRRGDLSEVNEMFDDLRRGEAARQLILFS